MSVRDASPESQSPERSRSGSRRDAEEVLGDLIGRIEQATDEVAGKYDWSSQWPDPLDQLSVQYAVTVRDFLHPFMRNQSLLKAEMGRKIRVKGADNPTYVVDYVGGQVLDLLLEEWSAAGPERREERGDRGVRKAGQRNLSDQREGLTSSRRTQPSAGSPPLTSHPTPPIARGRLAGGWMKFDEEDEQFTAIGPEPRKKIITDPFDNTSLGMIGYRDCNVAVCMADEENQFLNCAVADLQTDAVYFANREGAWLNYLLDGRIKRHRKLRTATKKDLADANLVVPHFKADRRIAFAQTPLFAEKVNTLNMGGPLTICRLAEGQDNELHGYLDFAEGRGQPIYEIVYFPLAIRAGACVTDVDGNDFDFAALVSQLEADPKARYRFVAACTPELHDALMEKIQTQ